MDLSIIVLTFNGKDLLKTTLDSIRSSLSNKISYETIVADNGSTDGLLEMVRAEYPWVKIVENQENLGFAAGNNKGVAQAMGDYILFLNSDTKILGNAINYVWQKMKSNPEIGIATCKVELISGMIDPASHRGFPTPWRAFCYYSGLEKLIAKTNSKYLKKIFGGYHLLDKDLNTEHEIDACTGAFFMISRDTGEQVGWWSESYFMYGEDLDFCMKVQMFGKKVMFFPAEKIIHYKHQSGLKKAAKGSAEENEKILQTRRKTTEAFYGAMEIFYNKYYRQRYSILISWLMLLGIRIKKYYEIKKLK